MITTPSSKGIKKLLIGPYQDRAAVDSALVRVRDTINKSAFVVKK
jgi:cell division septation protein DedD